MRVESVTRHRPGRPPLVDVLIDMEGRDYSDMATVTEQALRQLLDGNGWRTHTVPGHRSNTGGPDLVAYRVDPGTGRFALRILDNKATHPLTKYPGRAVSKASGLSARSLARNLWPIVRRLRGSPDPVDQQAVAALNAVRHSAVTAARQAAKRRRTVAGKRAAAGAAPLVLRSNGPDIRIAVTNVGGRSSGVTPRLARRGVQHIPWHQLEVGW